MICFSYEVSFVTCFHFLTCIMLGAGSIDQRLCGSNSELQYTKVQVSGGNMVFILIVYSFKKGVVRGQL